MGDLRMDDDSFFPDFLDAQDADSDPTARGIVQCLRMLADEAAALGMARTLDALQAAISVCAVEGDAADAMDQADDLKLRAAGSSRVH
jgi:hypothetical protein